MSKPIELASSRLRLVALTDELAALQVSDRMGFFKALGVEPEPSWPPELMDAARIEATRDALAERPGDAGWYSWVYISPVMHRLLGTGWFMGAPDAAGDVEIGYSMLTSYREQGLATEGVNALMGWAYEDPRVKRILAHTRDDRDAGHRVLEKAGFVEVERAHDDDRDADLIVWAHERDRLAA